MSFGGKDSETKETTQATTAPWAPAQGTLKDILGQAGSLYGQGQSALGGRSVDDLYGQSTNALGNLFSGSGPLSNLSSTANGDFLDVTHSPLWGSMTGGIQDAVNSQFSEAGRTGSPAHAGVMTSELGKLAGQLYGQERQNQLSASNSLGNFMQNGISAAPSVYDFGNADLNSLWQNLSRYASVGQGIAGLGGQSNSTTSSQQPSNMLGDLLGIGAGIAGLSSGGSGYQATPVTMTPKVKLPWE